MGRIGEDRPIDRPTDIFVQVATHVRSWYMVTKVDTKPLRLSGGGEGGGGGFYISEYGNVPLEWVNSKSII